VLIRFDAFEDWKSPMHDNGGNRLHRITDGRPGLIGGTTKSKYWYSESPCDDTPEPWLKMADVRARLFAMIDATPNIDYLLPTLWTKNIAAMIPEWIAPDKADPTGIAKLQSRNNVWLGAIVHDQQTADERIPHLLRVPAQVRFLLCEPLLGLINLLPYVSDGKVKISQGIDCDWVIAGGESGPHSRPMHPDWVRGLRDQCVGAGVPFWFSGWGDWWPVGRTDPECGKSVVLDKQIMEHVGKKNTGRVFDEREYSEMPTML
jgi:protein gp37